MNNYVVYRHTNKINQKVYIGMTMQKPERRWREGNGYLSLHFSNAIKKYGWDNFKHEIVLNDLSKEEACEAEKLLIEMYNATDPDYGYNEAIGGEGGGMYKKHHSEKSKLKISKARKIMGFSDLHRQHISESKSGTNHHFAKPVYQYSKDGQFIKKWDYMNDAAINLNLSKGNISQVCLGQRKTCGGYKWTYQDKGATFYDENL